MEKAQGIIKLGAVAVLCTLSGMFAYDLGWQQGGQRATQIRELASPSPAARWSDGRGGDRRDEGSRYRTSRFEPVDEAAAEGDDNLPTPAQNHATPASRGLPAKR